MQPDIKHLFFPETAFGGFSSVDGTIQFFTRVNALIKSDDIVLDIGAGRGVGGQTDSSPYRRELQILKGKCKRVIGIDIDPIVLSNPNVDQAFLMEEDGNLPFADGSIDFIVCDHTLEHITDPQHFSNEVLRVLKQDGIFCARTPNLLGYIGIGANLVPNKLHVRLLELLQPDRLAIDVFPTQYKLNTRSALNKYFPKKSWDQCMYTWNSEPAYFGKSKIAWHIMLALFRILPSSLGSTWNIFLRKH